MKQHFVQLAETFTPMPVSVCYDWYVSEKLDGQRAIWDGGRSRGLPVMEVPYANTSNDASTDYRATGLWSRYGKVIHAPDWFLDQLPQSTHWGLDLELWGGYNNFEWTTGVVRSKRARDDDWQKITAKVFDIISLGIFLTPRFVNVPTAIFNVRQSASAPEIIDLPFRDRMHRLYDLTETSQVHLVAHCKMTKAESHDYLKQVVKRGGEGLMLRAPGDLWRPERVKSLRKWKPVYFGNGVVVGESPGKGKYEGMVGALIIESKDHGQFQMSGMTDKQRAPGTFKVGTTVYFKYDGLTNDNKPRNVRYNPL